MTEEAEKEMIKAQQGLNDRVIKAIERGEERLERIEKMEDITEVMLEEVWDIIVAGKKREGDSES